MKNISKKLLMLFFSMLLCSFISIKAQAAERTINADGEWVSGSLTDSVQYYKFTIPSAGSVTFTLQSYSEGGRCELFDKDWSKSYGYIRSWDGSTVSPFTGDKTYDMEAGSYYLKICGYYGDEWSGDYRIKVSFKPANNNETEPNNNFDTAMPLVQDEMITGYITYDDDIDFYKFTLSTAQTVEIIWTNSNQIHFSVWDEDYLEVDDEDWFYSGSRTWEKYLQPGTYYIKFHDYHNSGTYTVKYRTKQYVSAIQLKKSQVVLNKGASYSLLSAVLPANATDKSLTWTTSNNDVASVTAGGKVTAKRAGYAWITAKSQDGTNIEAESVIIVKPEKAKQPSLEIASWDNHRIFINLKSIKGVSGYQIMYSTNKNFSKKSYFTTSYTNPYLYNCKSRTKYYIKVRAYTTYDGKNYYGAWSSAKSIKTKK